MPKRRRRKTKRIDWKGLAEERQRMIDDLNRSAGQASAFQLLADSAFDFLEERLRCVIEEVVDEKLSDAQITV